MEKVNYKKKVMELEGEVKKLSGQQNLQQRIHHHAKIKARFLHFVFAAKFGDIELLLMDLSMPTLICLSFE